MLGPALLRTILLLCLARLTLQGGTGYKRPSGGQAAPPKGYGLPSRTYSPRLKGLGHGALPLQSTGNEAAANGYGAQAAGNGVKPNGFGKMFAKGFGTAPVAMGNGAKAQGNTAPSIVKGNGGGYGAKPSKPGYGVQPSYGIGAGLGMVPRSGTRHRAGFPIGHGYRAPSFGGSRNGQAVYGPAGLGGGNGNRVGLSKPAKQGHRAGPKSQQGHGAKPKAYGTGVSALNAQGTKPAGYGAYAAANNGPRPGHRGYANAGAAKGPKAGYGGVPAGYGPNEFGAYRNVKAKASKPGYGNVKGPRGASLGPEAFRPPSVTKGVASPEPTSWVPAARPTTGVTQLLTNEKGPKLHTWLDSSTLRGEAPERDLIASVPQGKPAKPAVPGLAPVLAPALPQVKTQKPAAPLLPVLLGTAGLVPTGPTHPAPALLPFLPQPKAPKPASQSEMTAAAQQGPTLLQGKMQKPYIPALALPLPTLPIPPAGAPGSPAPLLRSQAPLHPLEPAQAKHQLGGPKAINPELADVMQLNGQRAKPARPDCAWGVSGQWTKLPNPGYGPAGWFPNAGGARAPKPGFGPGGDASTSMTLNKGQGQGYANREGLLPEPAYGNGQAAVVESIKGTSQIETQIAELGPASKPTGDFGLPYGAQPMGLGSEGSPVVQYAGVGGLPFADTPVGYSSNPYGKPGNPYGVQPYASKPAGNYGVQPYASKPAGNYGVQPYASKPAGNYGDQPYASKPAGNYGDQPYASKPAGNYGDQPYASKPAGNYGVQPYASKTAGNYGIPFRSKPQGLGLPPQAASKYGLGGLQYGGHDDATPSRTYGLGGVPYGGSVGPDAGKYSHPRMPYGPESVNLGADAKSSVKYGNPALAFDALGPVTDGKSIAQPGLPYEPLASGPQIDGVKSVDHFGEGEVPPQPNLGVGEGNGKSADTYGAKESKYNLKGLFGNGYQG